MKKLTIAIALVMSQILSFAQTKESCLPEGITFTTQEQIDNFQTNYPGCTEIEGDVMIGVWYGTSDITDLIGLNVVTSIGGYLTIFYNDFLPDFNGLENLSYVGGNISIGENSSISNLSGFNSLTSINNLYIDYNPNLVDFSGLENLTTIEGTLFCYFNTVLESLEGLNNLNYIGEDLIIGVNPLLSDLSALGNLTHIGGSLTITENDALPVLTGLECITSIGGSLNIGYWVEGEPYGNQILTSLAGLQNLVSIGGDLTIMGDNSFASLSDLVSLAVVDGNINIRYTSSLQNLTGLESLTSMSGNINIDHNIDLVSLSGLDNIEAASIGYLYICDNSNLSECDIVSVCDYLANPNGTINIHDNAPGCNSPEEVEEACLVGVGQLDGWTVGQLPVIVYPNPFSEIVHFEYEIENPSLVSFRVFNAIGEMVAVLQEGVLRDGKHRILWNAEGLPAGLYFCSMQIGQEIISRIIIKH